ncbi:MAG: hypothetical protein XD60_0790 [Acetothermia bacterium 64_32]|nr:MAG: hypothetical protein XD60_0790 [Acetothermia bacterium 64_32]HAF70172.1 hypothetical protein [Candidatus Acetothermia bacterium]
MRVLALGWDVEGPGVVAAQLPEADSLASFDAVLYDPASVPELWRGHAELSGDGVWRLYPGRDLGLSRALERLFSLRRDELSALLQKGGGLAVVRARAGGEFVEIASSPPHRLTPYSLLPHLSLVADPHHLVLPQGVRFIPRRGQDITWIHPAHPLTPYLEAFAPLGYEAVLVSSLGAPLSAFGNVLAKNRVGDVLAWDVPVGTGRLLFLPSFPGADPKRAGELLLPALGALLSRPLAEGGPSWLSKYTLPGEEGLAEEARALEAEGRRLREREEKLREAWGRFDSLRGLLFPRGAVGLLSAAREAMECLGFSCEPVPQDGLLCRAKEGTGLLRAAFSPGGPIGPEEHRALLLSLDRLAQEAHGILLVVAEPRLDPPRRGPQWTEAVRQGCRRHGITLLSGYQLFRALQHALGGGGTEGIRRSLLSWEGEWGWRL